MSEVSLKVESRKQIGKESAKKLRRAGKTPGIYYFHGKESIPISVDKKALHAMMGKESTLLDITIDNKDQRKCIIRDIQFDPITSNPIHIDLMGIELTEKVTVQVSIVLTGTPDGVKNQGGVLEQQLREISVECLPMDIPEHIVLDVSNLLIGGSLHVSDIQLDKVKLLDDVSKIIAHVVPPRVIEEPVAAEEEGAKEPEVIGKAEEVKEE
jgi:large subunit ribosomal protein L25